MDQLVNINDIIGKTFIQVDFIDTEKHHKGVKFVCEDGTTFLMEYHQD